MVSAKKNSISGFLFSSLIRDSIIIIFLFTLKSKDFLSAKVLSTTLEPHAINQLLNRKRTRNASNLWNIFSNKQFLNSKRIQLTQSIHSKKKLRLRRYKSIDRKRYCVNDHIPLTTLECLQRKRHEKVHPRKLQKFLDSHEISSAVVKRKLENPSVHRVSSNQSPPLSSNIYNHDNSKQLSSDELSFSSPIMSNFFLVSTSTAGSYISGGIFGYILGSARNLPSLLNGTRLLSSPNRFTITNNSALSQAKNCALLSASFTAFQQITKTIRRRDDKWNGIVGSFCTGVYLNYNDGLRKMLQSGITYGSVTYLLSDFGRMKKCKVIKNHVEDKVDRS